MGQKYVLDPDKLVFVEEQNSLKQYFYKLMKLTFIGVVLAAGVWFFSFMGLVTLPKSNVLSGDNNILIEQVKGVNAQFDSISNLLTDIQYRDDKLYRVITQIDPIPSSVRKAGFGGVPSYKHLDGYLNSELYIESNLRGDILIKQLEQQEKSYKTVVNCVETLNDSLLSIPAIMPISPNGYYRISSYYGYRIHPITKQRDMHDGIDFAAKSGRGIFASGNGEVSRISYSNRGYGNMVIIDHGFGFKTRFAHLDKIQVKKGDRVVRGEQIGTLGNTGRSTGPHLHYEVMLNNKRVDPADFYINDLSIKDYDEMISAFSK